MRTCNKCFSDKPESEFPKDRKRKDCNGVLRQFRCKKCKQKIQAEHRKKLSAMILDIKKKSKCEICNNDNYKHLLFHHINAEYKRFNISKANMQGLSVDTILDEISRCQILCANCHEEKHWDEKHKTR